MSLKAVECLSAMWWVLPLCLFMTDLPLSSQDMVTVAPQLGLAGAPEDLEPQVDGTKPSIRSLLITSHIMYRYATTVVSSRVVNPGSESGEAFFIITLPHSAFITDFTMAISDQVYPAQVKDKEEAKAAYSQSVNAGKFAGYVAQFARDSNQFIVSVNIEAHGKVTFNLTYEQMLYRDLGVYSNIINIDPQQVVPDMSVTVSIEEPTEIINLEVSPFQMTTTPDNNAVQEETYPNHVIKIEEKSSNHKVVFWAPTSQEQKSMSSNGFSGQFIIKYDIDRRQNSQQILVDDGYFVHFFAPESLPKLKMHVVFVLDYSGSMEGTKLDQLKEAMKKILSDLSEHDYFSIVIFQSYVEVWSPTVEELSYWSTRRNTILDHKFVVKATSENVLAAKYYLGNFSDLQGTNIMEGLKTGLALTKIGAEMWENESDPPQPVVVFLTDGQANEGETDQEVIIANTKLLNTLKCPIYSLGFGSDADFPFLRKLSLSNSGFNRKIYEAVDAAQQLEDFYGGIASPLISDVTFKYVPGQVDELSTTNTNFPKYYNGSELVVSGKFIKGKICALKENVTLGNFSGRTAAGLQTFPIIVDCTQQPLLNRPSASRLEKTWANIGIQQLLNKIDSLDDGDEKTKIKKKASDLALQYSFVTPLTLMVVFKPNNETDVVDTVKVEPGTKNKEFKKVVVPLNISHTRPATPPPVEITTTTTPSTTPTTITTLPTTTKPPPTTTGPPLGKVPVTEVKWLKRFIRKPLASTRVRVSILNIGSIFLGLNQPDVSVGPCEVEGQPGECRHIKYCALNVFRDDVTKFIPYLCSIHKKFLRVCCPFAAS